MELINAPAKNREIWHDIIGGSGYWFDKTSMRFFGSKILWNSLTYTETEGVYLFISEEDNFDRTERKLTIRMYSPNDGITTMTYDSLDLKEANHLLAIGSSANLELLKTIAEESWKDHLESYKK